MQAFSACLRAPTHHHTPSLSLPSPPGHRQGCDQARAQGGLRAGPGGVCFWAPGPGGPAGTAVPVDRRHAGGGCGWGAGGGARGWKAWRGGGLGGQPGGSACGHWIWGGGAVCPLGFPVSQPLKPASTASSCARPPPPHTHTTLPPPSHPSPPGGPARRQDRQGGGGARRQEGGRAAAPAGGRHAAHRPDPHPAHQPGDVHHRAHPPKGGARPNFFLSCSFLPAVLGGRNVGPRGRRGAAACHRRLAVAHPRSHPPPHHTHRCFC
jgi:hypothetical protein